MMARVEEHLSRHPDDGRGWEVIAPVYLRLGRFDEAVKARRKVLSLKGASAERESVSARMPPHQPVPITATSTRCTFVPRLAIDR